MIPDHQRYGIGSAKDNAYWDAIMPIASRLDDAELLDLWPAYVRRITMTRFLAHVELFRMIQDMPGNIVECGVCRGASFFTWHKLLEVYCPADTNRKVIGFDSFEGLTLGPQDGAPSPAHGKVDGGWAGGEEVSELLRIHNADSVIARERGIIVKGHLQDTLAPFIATNPGMRISLLHLDMDLYEPTLHALQCLYDLVLPGGLIVFDEFGLPPWEGETRAWEEFAEDRDIAWRMQKLPGTLTPNGFIVKGHGAQV